MSFFTDGPRERPLFPVREQELFGYEGRPWMGPPNDHIVPALLPWARPLGRSARTIIALRGIEVWPEAITLRIAVYSRDSLQEGRSGSLIDHRRIPDYNALLVGVLYPDGRRASSESISVPSASEPASPVLRAVGGGGTQFHLDHQIFVWPLPGDGPLTLVVQWLDRHIKETHTELEGAAIRAAAVEAGELWPGLPKRPGHGVALRHAGVTGSGAASASVGALAVRASEAAGPIPRNATDTPHEPLPRSGAADSAAPGEPFPRRVAFGAAEDSAESLRNPRGAAPLPDSGATDAAPVPDSGAADAAPRPDSGAADASKGNRVENATQQVAAPGEPLPQRSPSVLLPHLAGEASLLPRRNVALGPDRPAPRPPGTASPLPRRTPTRAGGAPTAPPVTRPAQAQPHAEQPAPPQSPAEPLPIPHRNAATGDSPTIAPPTPSAADPQPQASPPAPPQPAGETPPLPRRDAATDTPDPLPQPTPPLSTGETPPQPNAATNTPAPLPQPSRPAAPHAAAEGLTVAQPPALPQPSRPAKKEKPARGGWVWRRGARDPGE